MVVLTDTAVDLDFYSDHRRRHACLGTEDGRATVVGDLAMARYLSRRSGTAQWLLDSDADPPHCHSMAAAVDTTSPRRQRV